MALITCPKCGEKISDTSTQCLFCGTMLSETEIEIGIAQAQAQVTAKMQAQTNNKATTSVPKIPYNEISKNEKQIMQWRTEIEENRTGIMKFLAKLQSCEPSRVKNMLLALLGFLLIAGGCFIPAIGKKPDWMLPTAIAMEIIGTLVLFIPFALGNIYAERVSTSALELGLYSKKHNLNLQETVRLCLLRWNDNYRQIMSAWIYQKNLFNLVGNIINFVIGFIAFFSISVGLSLSLTGLCLTLAKRGSSLLIVGLVLLIAIPFICYIFSFIFKTLEGHEIFLRIKKHFSKEYEHSGAIEVYGIATNKDIITTTETVSYTDESGQVQTKVEYNKKEVNIPHIKNKWIALLFCFFLGEFGAHRFYEGKYVSAVLYLLTLGLFGIGWVLDLIHVIKNIILNPSPYYDIRKK